MVSYPTSLDNFTNPTSGDYLDTPGVVHHEQHSDLNDAVEALETKVGIDGSADTSSLDYKVANRLDLDQTTPQSVTGGAPIFDGVGYNTGYTPSGMEPVGTRYRDGDWGTTSLVLPDGVILQDGQEFNRPVYNPSATDTIPNGAIVYQSGQYGEYAEVDLADAGDDTKLEVIGIATHDILPQTMGKVTVIGVIHDVDTHLYSPKTKLYLAAGTPGAWTSTAPGKAIPVAVVQISDATNGSVYVNFAQPVSLQALTDVLTENETAGQVLTWNGAKRVNGNPVAASAGPGVNFYCDYTQIIGTGTENDHVVRSLSKAPTGASESIIATTFAGAGTQFVCAFLDSTLGRTTIDAGAWTFNSYVNTTITGLGQTSNYSRTVSKVSTFGAYTLTTTGTGTTRTATLSGSMFVAGDHNADIELTSYLQTPQGLYPIAGYTSGTVVTITVPSTYTNETGVGGYIWRKLFNFSSPTITTTYPSVSALSASLVESSFTILATDKLGVMTFAHATAACTVRLYVDGNTHATFFNSPLITFHNDLAKVQGMVGDEAYHLTAAEHTVATQTANGTRDGVLSSSDWTSFNSKVDRAGDTMTGDLTMGSNSAGKNITLNATLGNELFTGFAAGNRTLTSGREATNDGGTQLDKNADGTTTATLLSVSAVVGKTYQITYTTSGNSGGSYNIGFGGRLFSTITTAGTYTNTITASTTTGLVVTPNATATRFIISAISLKEVVHGTGSITVQNDLLLGGDILSTDGTIIMQKDSRGTIYFPSNINITGLSMAGAIAGATTIASSGTNTNTQNQASRDVIDAFVALANTTANANNNPTQNSPAIRFSGTAWDSASRTTNRRMSSSNWADTTILSRLKLGYDFNAGGFSELANVMDTGQFNVLGVTLGAENLTNGALTSGTSRTATGDFALTGNAATYTHSSGAGSITQTAANLAVKLKPNRWYKLVFTASNNSGTTPNIYIDSTVAIKKTQLPPTAATSIVYFYTAATVSASTDFKISGISGATGANTIDTLSLKEVSGGTVYSDNYVGEIATLGDTGVTGSIGLVGKTSGKVTVSVKDAAGTWTMKLPDNDGDANQVLTTDGSGNTSWSTPTATASFNPLVAQIFF